MTVDLNLSDRYLCLMFRTALIIMLIAFPAAAESAATGEASPDRPAEYMIYQYPEVALVVKIDAPETEFDSNVYGPEDALLKSSRIPFSRIGPLYQYIGAVDSPRQLMIKVNPGRTVDRAQIGMELIQLPERDRNSAALAQAYRLLSYGTESIHSNDSSTWAMKTYTLKNAARAFASLGWEEMRLWSEFYAAHLVLYKLSDVVLALELSREIQRSARKAGFEVIELAALILEGDALMTAGGSGSGTIANARLEQAHGVLDRVVLLADQLGLKSEQARALFHDGLAYERQQQLEAAIRQFQRALDVSLSTNDAELVNEIRGTAAAAYETLGSTAGAIEMLEDIGGDLKSDAAGEVAANLSERGRLLNSSYRYEEAVEELTQALELQRSNVNSGPWGATGLALAWSHYSLGDREQAVRLIMESLPRTPSNGNNDALVRAYSILAGAYRALEDYDQMSAFREQQAKQVKTEAQRIDYTFEAAMDARQLDGRGSTRAAELLAANLKQAVQSGQPMFEYRARLHQCLLELEQRGRGACSTSKVRRQRNELKNSGLPALSLEAEFVSAKILHREGRSVEALELMEQLIDEIRFFRQTLPGVLGSWYWNNKVGLFQEYMATTLEQSGGTSGGTVDGARVLLALNRIRLIEADEQRTAGGIVDEGQDESLRAALARREAAHGQEAVILSQQVNAELRALQDVFEPSISPLSPSALEKLLGGLSGDESLLTYYFTDSAGYILIGSRRGISLSELRGPDKLAQRLYALRGLVNNGSSDVLSQLESMGRVLLQPFAKNLNNTIYLLPAGPLNGFPFNALRINGKFLAERYDVINLVSLAPFDGRRPVAEQKKVFLAGNPQADRQLFSYDVQASEEVASVTDRFVGPGLHIVQGVALTREEFTDTRLAEAGLIHLAVPGTLDLAFPERSVLLMSRAGNDRAAVNLQPHDIRGTTFRADLAVLSQTAAIGAGRSGFDSRMGFVSDLLDGGVKNVLVSLWFDGEARSTGFVREFYTALEATGDAAEALSRTRESSLKSTDESNFMMWAGFQLFIR
ncbi:MAG: CHAT domain-containing protein [Xanthomonadales bacterium]|nr:CHAT domain-containing protein [Gammaproteobacteria bacterium]MBT8054820.1 CHAT domain-containing protein [Gammaproteobacteria bacterium]NND58501.1 CHAT domain-containing protein [Xanthomonadales bacterium]NNK51085.1 CHAT domain-containing protein [Xanthomonadales bacterium]